MNRKKYILGSGKPPEVKPPDTVYVDLVAWEGVDLVFDLEQPKWPIETGSALHLNATHVAEHISNFQTFMDECHRILSPGGSFYMEVPFAGNIDLAFSDPTHVRFFTNHTFINYLTVEGVHNFGYVRHAWSILHLANDGAVIRVHLAPVPDEYLTDNVLLALHNIKKSDRMNVNDICAIVLKYEEPEWTEQTLQCCEAAGITKIVIADRDGVGNMSKAFNRAAIEIYKARLPKFIWFLTNVTFTPEVPLALMAAFDDKTAAVHPCHDSDHAHLKTCGHTPQEVPFIEFTAPMFRTDALEKIDGADEHMPYWGMDLDWSYRAKQAGYNLKVSIARVQHVYLRHQKSKHPISTFREQLRAYHHNLTEAALVQKYGPKWEQILWPR